MRKVHIDLQKYVDGFGAMTCIVSVEKLENGKRCLNSYATADRIQGVWFNMTFLPVAYEEGNLCFCTYTMEINFEANLDRMASLPADVTSNVIKICLELRSAKEFGK